MPRFWHSLPLAPTRTGLAFLGACTFVFLAAVNSGVNLLYFLLGMLCAAFLLSLFLSTVCLSRISVRRDFGEHFIAGEPADIAYFVTNDKWFWPSLGLMLREIHPDLAESPRGYIMHLPATGRGKARNPVTLKLVTRLVARRRGLVRLSAIELSTTFPFGFIRHRLTLHLPQELVVYPRIGLLNRRLALQYRQCVESGTMTSNRRGGNDEFYGIREYRPGDNFRTIHWRSSARTGQLMIREMTANAPPQLIIILNLRGWREHVPATGDSDGPAGAPIVERAIELAAALVCYGFFENFAVGLAIAGLPDQPPPAPQMGRDARARLLRRLAVLDPRALHPDVSFEYPNRLAGRAEFLLVTLGHRDRIRDLLTAPGAPLLHSLSAGPPTAVPRAAGSFPPAGPRTVLSLDSPDASEWVRFLSPQETLRILRERAAD